MQHSFRDLMFIGRDGFDGHYQFAAERETPRLNGRGGLGWLVRVHNDELVCHRDGHVFCYCDEFEAQGNCWHAEFAPVALHYWTARLNLGDM